MPDKELTYKNHLSLFEDCPKEDCIERNLPAFRWVHSDATYKDFLPLSLHPETPLRQLDDSDQMCLSYGLSMFNSADAARCRYLEIYNKRTREFQKQKFKNEKGDKIAYIQITKDDGLSSDSNGIGHFTFYEYKGSNIWEKIQDLLDIFADNGKA